MIPTDLQELVDMVFHHVNRKKRILLAWGIHVSYTDKVVNTHCNPKGGVRNYSQRKDTPKGYPGWHGRIWHIYPKQMGIIHYNYFRNLGIHPGSGGYGRYSCPFYTEVKEKFLKIYPLSHDVSIFEDDWPSLKMVRALEPEQEQEGLFYIVGD